MPRNRHGASSTRNLILGILILGFALALLTQAVSLVGGRAALPLATALLTLVALFVLMRTRILRQRNGGFVALAVVCLLATLVPLVEYASSRVASTNTTASVQPKASTAGGNAAAKREDLPLLTEAYKISAPDEKSSRFKVLKDLRVLIEDKAYLIKEGEILAVVEKGNEEVRFNAGDQQIALPLNFVEMIQPGENPSAQPSGNQPQIVASPAPKGDTKPGTPANTQPSAQEATMPEHETPSQITQRAQKEAIRRYPALGMKDSPENRLFVETYQELKFTGAEDFFADPEWPLQLAELLAKRKKWLKQNGGGVAPEEVAPESDAPAGNMEEQKLPPDNSNTAGEVPNLPAEDAPLPTLE